MKLKTKIAFGILAAALILALVLEPIATLSFLLVASFFWAIVQAISWFVGDE